MKIEKSLQEKTFEAFWEEYPRKDAKKTAFKSWCKLKLTKKLYFEIGAALEISKATIWSGEDRRFIPLPATWLNQERWNDEHGSNQRHDTEGYAVSQAIQTLRTIERIESSKPFFGVGSLHKGFGEDNPNVPKLN